MSDPQPSHDPTRTVDHLVPEKEQATVDVSQPDQSTNATGPHLPSAPVDAPTIPGYRITAEIAKGGMGRVYAGHDLTLDREVAIKTLLPGANAARFVSEAKITARLPHPNIPPVHALGEVDGTPWLAMKYVHGQTLADLLNERATPQSEWPRFVHIFEQIAQAVGFAHRRGIIHRDLKPLNVMVGEFGEVQVMDWGLAKSTATGFEASPEAESDGSDVQQTMVGAVMGTPGYMAPEQARGEVVDARADVFALGAVLATILTGRPAFVGSTVRETIDLAARAELTDVLQRVQASGADAELIDLCQSCMKAQAEDRPADALVVAERVAEYRRGVDERLKQAESERTAAVVRVSETRKRQRLLLIAGGVIAAVLLAGLGASLWQMYRAIDAEGLAKTNAETADRNANESKQHAAEAQKNAETANARTKLALDAYGDFVFGIQDQLSKQPGTQELRLALLQNARTGLKKILDDARKQGTPDSTLVWSHFRMGDVEQQLGNTLAAQKEYQDGNELAKGLAEADPKNALAQRDLSISYDRLGNVTQQLGQTKEALGFYQKSLDIRVRLAETDPKNALAQRDLSISYDRLGNVTRQLGQEQEALGFYQKSLDIRVRLAETDSKNAQAQRDLSVSFAMLGDVTRQLGQTKEALGFYQKGLDVFVRLAEADPKNAQAQRDLSNSYNNLGDVTLNLGQKQEALGFYQKSHDIRVWLAETDPKNAQAQRALSISFGMLGDVTQQLGQTKEALAFYQKGLDIKVRLAEADPKNAHAQRDLSINYRKLGDLKRQLGQTKEALAFYQKSHDVRVRLADADPQNAEAQRDLAISYERLGSINKQMMEYTEAAVWYEKMIRLVNAWPNPKGLRLNMSIAENGLKACRNAEKAIADLEFVFQQPAQEIPGLLNLRVLALLKREKPAEAVTTAERYAQWAETLKKGRNGERYNAARAYALCAAAIEKDREKLIEESIKLLQKAKAGGYFTDEKIAQIKQDSDFNGIRPNPKFAAFVKELEIGKEPKK
jgi:tetratricopeptide (TPR) repeat protein